MSPAGHYPGWVNIGWKRWVRIRWKSTLGHQLASQGEPQSFFDHRLQYGLVQAQIGHDLLELAVFFLQLAQAAQLGRTNSAVTLIPDVEGLLADA